MPLARTLVAAALLAAAAAAILLVALTASSPNESAATGEAAPAHWDLPPAGAVADYQLGGSYDPPAGVQIVTRDSTEQPAAGHYSICYINGFQTQPGEIWPAELLLTDEVGNAMADPNWPDEYFLDISTTENRVAIQTRLETTIQRCATAGFQAVEFDNFDSYTRTDGALSHLDAMTFATALVSSAHEAGLAAGQKNTPDLAQQGATSIGFDFAVTEECVRYEECANYTRAYGELVFDIEYAEIEYADDLPGRFAEVCASADRPRSVMLRDHDLTPPSSSSYVYRHC